MALSSYNSPPEPCICSGCGGYPAVEIRGDGTYLLWDSPSNEAIVGPLLACSICGTVRLRADLIERAKEQEGIIDAIINPHFGDTETWVVGKQRIERKKTPRAKAGKDKGKP